MQVQCKFRLCPHGACLDCFYFSSTDIVSEHGCGIYRIQHTVQKSCLYFTEKSLYDIRTCQYIVTMPQQSVIMSVSSTKELLIRKTEVISNVIMASFDQMLFSGKCDLVPRTDHCCLSLCLQCGKT